jgi:hypothetical protein
MDTEIKKCLLPAHFTAVVRQGVPGPGFLTSTPNRSLLVLPSAVRFRSSLAVLAVDVALPHV